MVSRQQHDIRAAIKHAKLTCRNQKAIFATTSKRTKRCASGRQTDYPQIPAYINFGPKSPNTIQDVNDIV